MKITFSSRDAAAFGGDLLVFCITGKSSPSTGVDSVDAGLGQAFACGDFTAKAGQALWLYPEATVRARRVLVAGLGEEDIDAEAVRLCGGHVAREARKARATTVRLVLPRLDITPQETVWSKLSSEKGSFSISAR